MNLCDSDHDEVCYEGRNCPVCAMLESAREEIDALRVELKDVETERDDAQSEVKDLTKQIEVSKNE